MRLHSQLFLIALLSIAAADAAETRPSAFFREDWTTKPPFEQVSLRRSDRPRNDSLAYSDVRLSEASYHSEASRRLLGDQ